MYTTLASIWRFRKEQNTRRVRKKQKDKGKVPTYKSGFMLDILVKHAIEWMAQNSVMSAGDGTRLERQVGRSKDLLVGMQFDPDISKWPFEIMVPETAHQLQRMVMLIRKLGMLGSEVYTEQLRAISNKNLPPLVYATFPEASSGKSGFFTFKYWMHIIQSLHSTRLRLTTFVTDHCSVGIGGGKILNTPSHELLSHGCSYLGLPVDDYKYFKV